MQKFENMDLIAALEAIMHQNTAYYQSDFAYDIKMLREAARSDQPEDKLLLWLSRPSGTFCFRERDVLLKDTQAYNTWKFCGEQTCDRIFAYAVELTGAANGTVQGNLYELDYQQHFQHIRDAALLVGANRLIYESGMREIGLKEHFDSRSDKYFGEFVRYEMQPRDPELLQAAIRQEQRSRESAQPGDFKEHLAALHTADRGRGTAYRSRYEASGCSQQPGQESFHGRGIALFHQAGIQPGHGPAACHAAV